jgi:hypothetical protein
MDYQTLIRALQMAEAAETSGLPAVGLGDFQAGFRPFGQRASQGTQPDTYAQWKESLSKLKEANLTAYTTTLYGCTGLFGLCGPDEVVGLTMSDDKLIAWMNWRANNVCEQFAKFLTYMDVAGTAAGSPSSLAGRPCDDPPVAEKGTFEIFIGDKGLLRVAGNPIELTKVGERKCDKQPTYTLPLPGAPGGVRIDNDVDFEAIVAGEALKNEISRLTIDGDKTNAGEFDGLQQLVNTGYTDVKTGLTNAMIDSTIVAWANDNMDGAVNGNGNLIAYVIELARRVRRRVRMAGGGDVPVGEMVLVMPSFLRDCFLDAFACYGLCSPSQYNELFRDNLAVREFRDKFNGGLFGDGYITVDGQPIPIIAHDWLPVTQSGVNHVSDIYILTRRVGARQVLYGQYHPMGEAVDVARKYGADHYRLLQGDRIIQWVKWDNLCLQTAIAIKPNLYLSAPWAQVRITNVGCNPRLAPISDDPQSAYFVATKTVTSPFAQYWYKEGSGFVHDFSSTSF